MRGLVFLFAFFFSQCHAKNPFAKMPRNAGELLKQLDDGFDPNTEIKKGIPFIHFAAGKGHTEMVKHLLGHGADVDRVGLQGMTALHYASQYGHRAAVKLLLKRGASANLRMEGGETPLIVAAMGGHTKCVKVLLKYDKVDVNALSSKGMSALGGAAFSGMADTVRMLLAHGADASAGMTAAKLAQMGGSKEVMAMLAEHDEI